MATAYEIKKIDGATINKAAINDLTFEQLMGDAFARNDDKAKEFLSEKYHAKRKDGQPMPFTLKTKIEYLEKFCGYAAPKSRVTAKTREQKFADMFAAFEKLANAPVEETNANAKPEQIDATPEGTKMI